jgi:hypothetical protein
MSADISKFRKGFFNKLSSFNSKKGEGLSMNVMIVAILCIIVLVVLVMIFFKGTDGADKTLSSCLIGKCISNPDDCKNPDGSKGVVTESTGKCNSAGNKYCCVAREEG